MPRDGSGGYSLPESAFSPNTTISSTEVNSNFSDIATALTASIAKDGQTVTTASIPFAAGLATNTIAERTGGSGVTVDGVLLKDGGATLKDSVTQFQDDGDATKQLRFQLSGFTTGNIRTATWPDADITVVGTATTQTLINKTLSDSTTFFADESDATKLLQLQLSGITTSTTRTLTVPDASDTIAVLALAQTFTNKTLTSPVLNTGVSGTALAAQADMETATSTSLLVTPGRVKYDPGVAKASCKFSVSGGTVTLDRAHNVSSITDNGVGDFTVNWGVTFSDAHYPAVISGRMAAGVAFLGMENMDNAARTTTALRILTLNASSTAADPVVCSVIAMGDL